MGISIKLENQDIFPASSLAFLLVCNSVLILMSYEIYLMFGESQCNRERHLLLGANDNAIFKIRIANVRQDI